MTKFYNFLNEITENKGYPQFLKECKPFLKDLSLSGRMLYSGRKKETQDIVKKKIRKDRRPLDTDIHIHDFFNDEFKKKFGVAARSESLFVSLALEPVLQYGTPYYVFPIGNSYKFIYSNVVSDLFRWVDRHFATVDDTDPDGHELESLRQTKVMDSYKQKNKLQDIKLGSDLFDRHDEIMLVCNEVGMINSLKIPHDALMDKINEVL